jgi:hypothetical protein
MHMACFNDLHNKGGPCICKSFICAFKQNEYWKFSNPLQYNDYNKWRALEIWLCQIQHTIGNRTILDRIYWKPKTGSWMVSHFVEFSYLGLWSSCQSDTLIAVLDTSYLDAECHMRNAKHAKNITLTPAKQPGECLGLLFDALLSCHFLVQKKNTHLHTYPKTTLWSKLLRIANLQRNLEFIDKKTCQNFDTLSINFIKSSAIT